MNLSDKVALVVDNGLFMELARKLAGSYKTVYYYTPWQCAFPTMNEALRGYGYEGLTLIKSPFDVLDKVDISIFPDIYWGSLQDWLRREGRRVWGSGLRGEELELDRVKTLELMKSLNYPVQHYDVVVGMADLRTYLKSHKKVFVKISRYRGEFETFYSPNYDYIEPRLDVIEATLGKFKSMTQFIVEDELPKMVEVGLDTWTVNGQWPETVFHGIEVKGEGYIGCTAKFADIFEPLTRFERLLSPTLQRYGYAGFWSAEKRIGKPHVPWMIDVCARAAFPPNGLYQENLVNLAEIIWAGSEGVMLAPKYRAKWGAEMIMDSPWAEKNFLPVTFPAQYRDKVKLRNSVRIDGKFIVVPQAVGVSSFGSVIGLGNSMADAVEAAREVGATVSGIQINIATESLAKAEKKIAEAKGYGIPLLGRK